MRDWEGTASELLAALEALAAGDVSPAAGSSSGGRDVTKQKSWPKNGRSLSNELRRLAPTLRATGIVAKFTREAGGHRRRLITLRQDSDITTTL